MPGDGNTVTIGVGAPWEVDADEIVRPIHATDPETLVETYLPPDPSW